MLPFHQRRIDPAVRPGWLHESYRRALVQRFNSRVRIELQRMTVDVDVAIARIDAEFGVGRITDAGLERLDRRFDQRQLHRRVVGFGGIGIDRRLCACEVAGAIQPPQVLIERRGRIEIARLDRVVVAHQRFAVA